jgi:LacI family transcriptional regulator
MYSGSTDSEPTTEEGLALAMCARRVDGLIIIPAPGSHDYLVSEIEAGVATVFVLRPPDLPCADTVLPDARGAAQAAVAHLAAHGHRRIGFVGGPACGQRTALRDGYAHGMAAAGLPADPVWQALDAAALAGASLPVTAVFCASQALTRAALRALAARGDDPSAERRVAVIGFGDFELADLVSPPVTVVSYDPVRIGYTAGELLLRRLAGQQAPPSLVQVPVRLVARGSAEFPPRAVHWSGDAGNDRAGLADEQRAEDRGEDGDNNHDAREQADLSARCLHLPCGRQIVSPVLERLEMGRVRARACACLWHGADPTRWLSNMRGYRICGAIEYAGQLNQRARRVSTAR